MPITSHRLLALALVMGCALSSSPPAASPSAAGAASAGAPPASYAAGEHAGPEHGSHEHAEHELGFHKDFSDAEAYAGHFDDPAREAWQHPDAVVDLLRIPPGSTVVDLGAGTGYFVGALARAVGDAGKVQALDVEPKMVDFLGRRVRAQKLSNVEPRLVRPDDPGLSPASVSRILIVNTWHHIDDRSNYAKKLAAALAADGEVWVVDFTLEADLGPPREYRIPAERVASELEDGGLHARVLDPDPLPKQYIVRATRQ